jgi:hypothetical protein
MALLRHIDRRTSGTPQACPSPRLHGGQADLEAPTGV